MPKKKSSPGAEAATTFIRNGMALCKLCHWAFDHGRMGVADDFAIIVPARVAVAPNAPGFLTALAGRPIILSVDPALRPAPENLAAHRRVWRLQPSVRVAKIYSLPGPHPFPAPTLKP